MNQFLQLACGLLVVAAPVAAQTSPTPLVASALTVGATAPAFKAQAANGRPVELKQLLKKGPVVLYFYRGQWCPYCSKELSQLQDSLQVLTGKGAQIVVVTPEIQENIDKTRARTKATFPIVHDQNLAIMKAYKTARTVDDATAAKYQGYGIDFKKANGLDTNVLPVPATYVIGRDGKIKFAFFNPDYRYRASVRQVAAVL